MIRFLSSIDRKLGLIFERIKLATRVSDEELALYRILFGSLLLCYFSPSWSWLGGIPPAFFDPYMFSFANLTDNHLPLFAYRMADVTAVVFLIMITLGIRTRWACFGMFLLSAVFLSYYYSFGKIDHHTTLLLCAYPVFGFTNSGTKFALVKDKRIATPLQDAAIALLALGICFGFFSAGLPKLLKWVDFDLNSSGFLFWFYPAYFLEKNQMFLAPIVHQLPVIVLEAMDYLAVLFEISGFFFLLRGKKSWILYLTIACVFHLANLLLLNIDFTMNILTYGFFILAPVIRMVYIRYRGQLLRTKTIGIILLAALAFIKIGTLLGVISGVFFNYETIAVPLRNYMNLVVWLCALVCGALVLKIHRKSKA